MLDPNETVLTGPEVEATEPQSFHTRIGLAFRARFLKRTIGNIGAISVEELSSP